MEETPVRPPAPASGLTRALCAVVFTLMTAAVIYAASIAIRYLGRISV